MENQLRLPQQVLNNMICFYCGNYLNVAPITIISEDGDIYKCGRCQYLRTDVNTRNLLFENVASYLPFSCMYQQCSEKVTYGKVEDHERDCKYRTVSCPIYWDNCTDVVEANKLRSHFQQKHSALLHFGEANFNYSFGCYCIHMLEKDQRQFLVYAYQDAACIYVGVFSFQNAKDVRFEATLSSPVNDGKPYITFVNKDVIPYNERETCLKCVGNKCNRRYHRFFQDGQRFLETFSLQIKRDHIKYLLSTDQLNYIITVVDVKGDVGKHSRQLAEKEISKEHAVKASPFFNTTKTVSVYDTLRDKLECPICQEYMMSPIYSCKTGHVICNSCKPYLEKCPMCRENIQNSRNFALEEIARVIEMPCQYATGGCTFTGNVEKNRQHEPRCLYRQ